jgi:hypothetical protein
MVHSDPATSVHRLIRPGSGYAPATQGAIGSIDVSWDRRLFVESIALEGFLVEQNGIVYRTAERAIFLPTWQSDRQTGLVASSFDDGSGGHPDFSASGSLLRFGYFRRTTVAGTIAHGIDNFAVTVHVGSPGPGRLAFEKILETVEENGAPFITVQRLGGRQGAVTADLLIERPNGSTSTETFSWADGDDSPRSTLVIFLDLPAGSGARTARLALANPTGGATIHPSRGVLSIVVFPASWGPQLRALFLALQGLFAAFSPAWLLVLAVLVALAVRRSRRRMGSRARAHS